MVATDAGKLVLFGGHDYARAALNDVWVLDVGDAAGDPQRVTWRRLEGMQLEPEPRAYHAAAMLGNLMLVSGGELWDRSSCSEMWALDVDREAWRRVGKDLADGGRMRHAMCCTELHAGASGGVVALCGGHGREASDPRPVDVALLRLEGGGREGDDVRCEELQAPEGADPQAAGARRREAALLKLDTGHLVLFGGNSGELTDHFGDGYHQYGFAETLVADAPNGFAGSWRRVAGSPPDFAAPGCAVAALTAAGKVVVVDFDAVGDSGTRVHVLSLSPGDGSLFDGR